MYTILSQFTIDAGRGLCHASLSSSQSGIIFIVPSRTGSSRLRFGWSKSWMFWRHSFRCSAPQSNKINTPTI